MKVITSFHMIRTILNSIIWKMVVEMADKLLVQSQYLNDWMLVSTGMFLKKNVI